MVPFNDLKPRYALWRDEFDGAVRRVLDRGWFILGPELEAFEAEFAAWLGTGHAIGVAQGTDAVEIALRALGVGPGDEVITASHTAAATLTAVRRLGAVPVLVDIDPETYCIDPNGVEAAITYRTRALLPVHLYGHPADLSALSALARRYGLLLVEDCAQAHGAAWHGRAVGTWGDAAAFSFYPTKNLGAFGDAGLCVFRDPAHAGKAKRLRNYGQDRRYFHDGDGFNSRLDEMQAALLRIGLAHLHEATAMRRDIAASYSSGLAECKLPACRPGAEHVYHLYVVRHPDREGLRMHLDRQGVGSLIHYPVPNHLQKAFADLGYRPGDLPETERAAGEILSLPMYPGLTPAQVRRVIDGVNGFAQSSGRAAA